ncbi:MAG TPA: 3,4-dihydroxy-2-butanone-4-phosphate synthase [Gaiellaceae bacterium]|jgi:3,4-dihydroxy 2-butanone 4-phosphate synthase/GTP cyclohydrolase II|nr:3,4-dihydroxy-2-butanone-4-phosphate synthase [Gaiellaceae bacterium]
MNAEIEQADPEAAREAARVLANGGYVVLAESRAESAEGNLMLAAQFVTPDAIGFLTSQSPGVVRLCLTDERCAALGLGTLVESESNWQPTASIAHRSAAGRGASTDDRARTIQAAVDPSSTADDFVPGGYVFPLRARPGGVLRRAGRTEAAIDLASFAGCIPAAVLSLVMNGDGSVARGPELPAYAAAHGYPLVTVGDVIALRRMSEKLVERFASARIPTPRGEFMGVGYRETLTGAHHLAFVKGEVEGAEDVLVRVHVECVVGDVFGTTACTCAHDMERALDLIEAEGRGVLLYLVDPDGTRRVNRHAVDPGEASSSPMDEYGIGAQILADLGLKRIRVLTDHPRPIPGLEGFGLEVAGHAPLATSAESPEELGSGASGAAA